MPRSRLQQGAHQAHRRVHLVVAVQGFPQQLVQGRPARHRQVLGLPHALGKVAVDVGLGEHQVFVEFLGEARPGRGLSQGAQVWWGGSAVGLSHGGGPGGGGSTARGTAEPVPGGSGCQCSPSGVRRSLIFQHNLHQSTSCRCPPASSQSPSDPAHRGACLRTPARLRGARGAPSPRDFSGTRGWRTRGPGKEANAQSSGASPTAAPS